MGEPEAAESRSGAFPDGEGGGLDELVLVIPGDPVPWTPKQTNRKSGNRFLAPRQEAQIGRILAVVERTCPDLRIPEGEPWLIGGEFYVARPKSHYRTGRNAHLLRDAAPAYPTGRPDFTNLLKLAEDALVLSGRLPDDDQIVGICGEPRKLYAPRGEQPRSVIRLRPLR